MKQVKKLCFLATLLFFGFMLGNNVMAQTAAEEPLPAQEQAGPTPEENRAAFIGFLRGSIESGFMDEWRGKRPMKTMEDVGEYLSTFNLWAFACQDAPNFNLTEEEAKALAAFRKKAEAVQAEAFPKLRDNFGPVLRAHVSQVEVSARTIGEGFRIVDIVGKPFNLRVNVDQFHEQVKTVLFQLRFSEVNYKLSFKGKAFHVLPLSNFKDTDMIVWKEGLNYEIVK